MKRAMLIILTIGFIIGLLFYSVQKAIGIYISNDNITLSKKEELRKLLNTEQSLNLPKSKWPNANIIYFLPNEKINSISKQQIQSELTKRKVQLLKELRDSALSFTAFIWSCLSWLLLMLMTQVLNLLIKDTYEHIKQRVKTTKQL